MSFRKFSTGEVIPPEETDGTEEPEPSEIERQAMSHVDRADLDYADDDGSDGRR